jgi:hypothetical protein
MWNSLNNSTQKQGHMPTSAVEADVIAILIGFLDFHFSAKIGTNFWILVFQC